MTMPIMAPGLKPSLRELAFGMVAGGASGMEEVMGVGAIMAVRVVDSIFVRDSGFRKTV